MLASAAGEHDGPVLSTWLHSLWDGKALCSHVPHSQCKPLCMFACSRADYNRVRYHFHELLLTDIHCIDDMMAFVGALVQPTKLWLRGGLLRTPSDSLQKRKKLMLPVLLLL